MEIKIFLDDNDITRNLEKFFVSLAVNDNLSGEADTLDLTLADKDKKFLGEWFPSRGAKISASVADDFDLGSFEIDEVTYSSPPSTIKIKATSISQNSGLRQTDESKSWEHVKLSEIARDIAKASGVDFFYEADFDPTIDRAEQGEQSRLAFLEKICADWGLIVKFSDGKLIVYPESSLEIRDAVLKVFPHNLIHFDAKATLNEVYKDCQVNYKHGTHSELYSATATDETKSSGKTLKINKKVSSQAEAEHLARHELRKKNKHEYEMTLTLRFDKKYQAGNCLDLADDFGFFAGKWLIDKANHSFGRGGSVSKLQMHRSLSHEQT